jgi:hypothetical protein
MGAALTREQELRQAVKGARLPPRDFKIFTVLLDRADWGTAEIPGRFQPRSLDALAALCEMSRATLCRGLAHLEQEGWVKRGRTARGRACPTGYTLALGGRCECARPGRPSKQETVSPFPETVSGIPPKLSHQRGLNSLRNSDKSAGQAPVSAGGHLGGEMGGTAVENHSEPVCGLCGAPVSALRRAQTAARGAVVCVRCEAADSPPVPVLPAPAGEPEPVCGKCGAPVSPLDLALGLGCARCEEAGPPGGGLPRSQGDAPQREGRRE